MLVARISKGWVAEIRQTKRLIQYVDELIQGKRTQCPVRPQYTIPIPYNPDILCTGVARRNSCPAPQNPT